MGAVYSPEGVAHHQEDCRSCVDAVAMIVWLGLITVLHNRFAVYWVHRKARLATAC